MPPPTVKGLGKKTLSGISWTAIGSVVSNIVRIGALAALGRLLAPADFGLVAAGITVIAFARVIKDVGVGHALIQRKEIEPAHAEAAFGFSLLWGLFLTAVIFFGAPQVAALYDMPHAVPIIRGLSISFLIRGIGSTSMFLCQRDLSFRALALVDVASYTVGSGVSVVLAARGMGAWALVIGYQAESCVSTLMLLVRRPPPFTIRIPRAAFRDLLGFGSGQTLARIMNYIANQGDYIVVGRYLDAVALGFYTRAYELMRFPATTFSNIAGNVLFSSTARLQDEPERLGAVFRRILFTNAILLLPISAGVIVLAPEAVRLLMGPGWTTAVLPFQIMALSILFRTSYKASDILMRSGGDVFRLAAWHGFYAVLVVAGALMSVHWGIIGVSCTTAAAVAIHFFAVTRVATRRIRLGWRPLVSAHISGLVAAALVVAGALPVAMALRSAGAGPLLIAIAGTLAGSVGPLVLFAYQLRRGNEDWQWMWKTLRQALGKKIKRNPPPVTAAAE